MFMGIIIAMEAAVVVSIGVSGPCHMGYLCEFRWHIKRSSSGS
jgi:hypothetical protein